MHKKLKIKYKLYIPMHITIIFISMFFLFSNKSYAQGLDYSIEIKQNIQVNDNYIKPKDTFTYIVEPISKNAPLPNNDKNGKYEFNMVGEGHKKINFNFQKPGEYIYKIYPKKNDNIEYLNQDKEEYQLKIYVVETDKGLIVNLYMIINSKGYKVTDIEFTNSYYIKDKKTKDKKVNNSTSKQPKTGVESVIYLYISIILLSLLGLIISYRKKYNIENRNE